MDILLRQVKGTALTHQEMDGNLIAIRDEFDTKAPISHVGAGDQAHAQATTLADGFMSKEDKSKLDGVTTGAAALGSATPLMDSGSGTAGTSPSASHQDHIHPTDTSRAPLNSPALTGTPTAPTATAGTNTTQIATMAALKTAIDNLINVAPSTLDTLKELADAIGDDANYAATITTALGKKGNITYVTFVTGTAAP